MKLRNEIIQELCNDSEYKKICYKISTSNKEDFYSECILRIIELNDERIEQIYNAGLNDFKLYCTYIAWAMFKNKYSPFNKKYNQKFISIEYVEQGYNHTAKGGSGSGNKSIDTTTIKKIKSLQEEKELDFELLSSNINTRMKVIKASYKDDFPYDVKMFELYLKLGSLRKISKATGIPHTTCYNSVNRIKTKIKDAINLEHYIS